MSKQKDKCIFNDSWLSDQRFSEWLKKATAYRAYCKLCAKDFDISNMGVSALVSHAGGKKHQEIQKSKTACAGFFNKTGSSESNSATVTKQANLQTIPSIVIPLKVVKAEIMWVLKTVYNHFSLRSCLGLNEILKAMFDDSEIAKSFKLSKTKCRYLINYGLAPYFQDILNQSISSSPYFIISFDESMNKMLQNEQMDLTVRFWDDNAKRVRTRYYKSCFLNRPNAQNLLTCLLEATKSLPHKRLLQISMDGPSTNWKVLELLNKKRSENEDPTMVNIGSCGLHIVHGAFKTGVESSDWKIAKLLKSMWQLFHDSPARRELYIRLCESEQFPCSFSATRWLEDRDVAIRAMKLWPNIVKMIQHWESLSKSRRPNNKSYETLLQFYNNKTVPHRLQFFIDLSSQMKGFLELFQTDKPMVPFLQGQLADILKMLLKMVVKPDVFDELVKSGSSYQLVKFDVSDSEKLAHHELVKLPTATKSLLKSAPLQIEKRRSFLKDCKTIVVSLIKKLQERSPLNYLVCRNASSLLPSRMVNEKLTCSSQFGCLVDKLYELKWFSSERCDSAKKEYESLLESANTQMKDRFLTFKSEDRIDEFFAEIIHGNPKYKNCWEVFKLIFTLSHGQASVERGFSINKELLTENLQEVSIVSQRTVYDYMMELGKPVHEIPLTNDLIKSCKLAHSRYSNALEIRKSKNKEEEKSRKRKLKLEEIAEVKEKKQSLLSCINSLEIDIESYSIAAEKENDLSLLTKANSFRVTVKSKKETLSVLDGALQKLENELAL